MTVANVLFLAFMIFACSNVVSCWDSKEMRMFDLVEEIKENFYQYMGLEQNATIAEVRRTYRKLSLKYHPDRNPSEEDSLKFQRIADIYEILKDETLRERYDEILKYGLPDWKMPVFYYRKLRRMSFVETFVLFTLLSTFIHYACLWGVYFEKKLNVEDYFRKKKVRKSKKLDKEDAKETHLKLIPTPTWKDILPLALTRGTYYTLKATPDTIQYTFRFLKKEAEAAIDKKFEKERIAKQIEEEKKRIEEEKRQRKQRKLEMTKEHRANRRMYEEAKENAMALPLDAFLDIPIIQDNSQNDNEDNMKTNEWQDEDTVLLIRALAKYSSGVKDRWLKISTMVRRPISQITAKVKEIQQMSLKGTMPVSNKVQNTLADGIEDQRVIFVSSILQSHSTSPIDNDDDVEDNDSEFEGLSSAQRKKLRRKKMRNEEPSQLCTDECTVENNNEQQCPNKDDGGENTELDNTDSVVTQRKKPRKKAKYLEENNEAADLDSDGVVWSQIEQKQLEDAMRAFPKGTSERWDKISQKVPTKTKNQCIERIKSLSQKIQNQKHSSDKVVNGST